jgi:hypothetical protein
MESWKFQKNYGIGAIEVATLSILTNITKMVIFPVKKLV